MVARSGNVEHCEEVRRLARAGQHSCRAALKLADLRRHVIVRGVLQARVEVARLFQVEQLSHVLRRVVFPRGGLVNRNLARLRVARSITALHARGPHMLRHVWPPRK